jgi:hypothetical protein
LAQVECGTRSNSTPESDDETNPGGAKSPVPIPLSAIDPEQREELEQIIRDLEEENATLQAEYDRLRTKQTPSTTPDESQAQTTPTQSGQGQV